MAETTNRPTDYYLAIAINSIKRFETQDTNEKLRLTGGVTAAHCHWSRARSESDDWPVYKLDSWVNSNSWHRSPLHWDHFCSVPWVTLLVRFHCTCIPACFPLFQVAKSRPLMSVCFQCKGIYYKKILLVITVSCYNRWNHGTLYNHSATMQVEVSISGWCL